MNDGLLKLERQCRRRMTRLTKVATSGSAKDKRKVCELWTQREPKPGNMHKPGAVYACLTSKPD